MPRPYEVSGTYGSRKTPCTVFVYPDRDGTAWYVVEGSTNVNCTDEEIQDGVNVEELPDHDTFTAGEPINSLEALESAVDDQ